uniref:ACTIN 4 n=1 Tax=Rhizophora mucronata TaxID=61149 RepID=A0A2P2MF19_RHIMU
MYILTPRHTHISYYVQSQTMNEPNIKKNKGNEKQNLPPFLNIKHLFLFFFFIFHSTNYLTIKRLYLRSN